DRRTILTLVLMPLLLYPLLTMAFPQFLGGAGGPSDGTVKVGVPATPKGQPFSQSRFIKGHLHEALKPYAGRLVGAVAAASAGNPLAALPGLLPWREPDPGALPLTPEGDVVHRGRPLPRLEFYEAKDLEKAVRDGEVDLGIRLRGRQAAGATPYLNWELLY